MGNDTDPAETKPSREQRLAAKLRENLHRRKAQARALDHGPDSAPDSSGQGDAGTLPKPPASG